LSGSHCIRILKHLDSECRSCPADLRKVLDDLSANEEASTSQASSHDRGARKQFVAFVWSKLRKAPKNFDAKAHSEHVRHTESSGKADSAEYDECSNPMSSEGALSDSVEDGIPWSTLLRQSILLSPKDRHLVPDTTLLAISQMKPWPMSKKDHIGRYKDQSLGFMGMACVHCVCLSIEYFHLTISPETH
jgi:hypothetical protein